MGVTIIETCMPSAITKTHKMGMFFAGRCVTLLCLGYQKLEKMYTIYNLQTGKGKIIVRKREE